MKDKIKLWITGIWVRIKKPLFYFCLFLCILSIGYFAGCNRLKKERALNVANLVAVRDSIRHYSVTIDGLKNSVYEKSAIILSQDQAIQAGIIERDYLKKLHIKEIITNTDLNGTIRVLRDSLKMSPETIFVTIKDTSGVASDYIRVPFTLLDVNEKYISLEAGMRKNRLSYFDLSVPVSGEMTIGYKRSGFLKTIPVGLFTSKNPYLSINQMDVLIIQEPKHFYQKTWFHFLAGGLIVEGLNLYLKK